MSEVEEITNRLLHGSPQSKGYAAMMIYCRGLFDKPVIDLLISSLAQVAEKDREHSKEELGFVTFGIVALSLCIKELNQGPDKSPQQSMAEQELLKLAQSDDMEIAGTAMFWIGQLEEAGRFAIHPVLGQRAYERMDGPIPDRITLRAAAYRSILRIDSEYARTLGDIPARDELRHALNTWISESTNAVSREKLQSELMTLETIQ